MFGCSGACFNRAVDCQTRLGRLRSQSYFHGGPHCLCMCGGGWKGSLTHVYGSELPWVARVEQCQSRGLANAGTFVRDSFFLHVHLYICRRTFAGPGRALRNRMELIAATRKKNYKTDPLPMIVIRGENDINEPGRAGRVFHAPVLTSSPVTAVQTVQGSGCFNALMTRAVSRGQIDGRRDSWELSDMSVLIW